RPGVPEEALPESTGRPRLGIATCSANRAGCRWAATRLWLPLPRSFGLTTGPDLRAEFGTRPSADNSTEVLPPEKRSDRAMFAWFARAVSGATGGQPSPAIVSRMEVTAT